MSEAAFALNAMLALLKRAARGETLAASDVGAVDAIPGRPAGASADRALHYLHQAVADAELLESSTAYRADMILEAAEHVERIERDYEEVLC